MSAISSRAGLQSSPMGQLPPELTLKLFQDLAPWDIIRLGMACYDLRGMSKDDLLWNSKVENALSGRDVDQAIALALIYLVGKGRPRNEHLGYELAARVDRKIKRPAQTALEEFVLNHSRISACPRPSLAIQMSKAQTQLPFFQGLVDEGNPFALYSQGLCDFQAERKEEERNHEHWRLERLKFNKNSQLPDDQ